MREREGLRFTGSTIQRFNAPKHCKGFAESKVACRGFAINEGDETLNAF